MNSPQTARNARHGVKELFHKLLHFNYMGVSVRTNAPTYTSIHTYPHPAFYINQAVLSPILIRAYL
jgi:hypothetical protein